MSQPGPIRVLIVDDHELFTHALTATLADDGRFEVVGTAVNGKVALSKVELLKPDLITMDI